MMKYFLVALCLLCQSVQTTAQDFESVLLDHPNGSFFVSGLNNAGQVCGSALVDDINFVNHAIRFEPDGTFKTLALGPLGISATASGINDYGHVIGVINRSDFTSITVIWETDSTFRELLNPALGGTVIPQDVNNNGEAVGYIFNFNGTNEAVFWDSTGNIEVLPRPEGGAEARALNDNSQIVGRVFDLNGNRLPMRWDPLDSVPARQDNSFVQVPIFGPDDGFGEATGIHAGGLTWGIADRTGLGNPFTYSDRLGLDIRETEGEIFDINPLGSEVGLRQTSPNAFSPYIKIGLICQEPDGLTDGSLASAVSAKEINDNNWVVVGDINSHNQLWRHRFTFTLDQSVPSVPQRNQFQTWAEMRGFLVDETGEAPSTYPLNIAIEEGDYDAESIYLEDSWAPSATLNIAPGVHMEELETETGLDAHIVPRLGANYELKGNPSINNFISGSNLIVEGPIDLRHLVLNSEESQSLKNFLNNPLFAEALDISSSLSIDGQVTSEQFVLSGQVIGETSESGIILSNSRLDIFSDGFNSPAEGSPVFIEGESAQVNGLFERRSDVFNAWNAPEENEGYFFPLRDQLIIQPTGQTVSGAAVDLSTQVIEAIEANLQMPTEFEDGGLTDFELTTPRVYFLGVRLRFNRRAPLTDPLEANLRVPAAILDEVENPNLYRLLLFDCNGNFIGPAGTFIPPSGEDQTSLLYTGLIDGVYNISHSAALLDSCQYLAIAKGEMITSIKDLSGWSQGFQVENPLPNPFRQKTQISYLLPQSARVDASIIDLLGREVRNLIVRVDQSGTHELEWDGAGDSGEKLTRGLYYLAIKFSDPFGTDFHYIQSKKLVLAD